MCIRYPGVERTTLPPPRNSLRQAHQRPVPAVGFGRRLNLSQERPVDDGHQPRTAVMRQPLQQAVAAASVAGRKLKVAIQGLGEPQELRSRDVLKLRCQEKVWVRRGSPGSRQLRQQQQLSRRAWPHILAQVSGRGEELTCHRQCMKHRSEAETGH